MESTGTSTKTTWLKDYSEPTCEKKGSPKEETIRRPEKQSN